ncbi:hypothetical protein GmHk_11G032568 [Glycine max]|nr:hypothetical protein GmHk_11G032568 [Glycine max]
MNSIITVLYFNGRVYEDNDGKYVALQICDDEDVETMIESFQQQQQMSVLELYVEKDVAGGSMYHSANSVTSCGHNLSHHESELPRNINNLHDDEDDDDDYLASNSYVEDSLDEDDSVDGISNTDDEVTNIIEPVSIVHPTEGVLGIQNPFWNDALHYNNINWSHPDEEDICGLDMPTTFSVGQELYVGKDFDSKDAVKNALKQYVMKVHQTYTPCKHVFDQNLEKFRQLSPAIATWIDHISKEKWSMTYDTSGRRYGHMTTNLSECVNKVLKDCRSIPITSLVKSTYSRCQKYFVDHGRQAQRQLNEGQVYCSKLVKELRKNQEQACSHIVRVYDIHSTRFECDDPEKDTDASVSDTEQMFVACNTFHGHALPFVGNILSLQQPLFVCLCPEFQHLTEECETLVLEIDALMQDHVTQAQ